MCDCIKIVTDGVKKAYEAETVLVPFEFFSGRTYTCCEVYRPGKKKPLMSNVAHSFCPFCGEKYEKKLNDIKLCL